MIATTNKKIYRPIVRHLQEPGSGAKIPINIFSIPVKNKIKANIYN
jgi:hypothetical protein